MYGERLRLRRKSRGLNQTQLAKIVDCNKHTISNYEQLEGDPGTRISKLIADVLGEF